ncbi:MAG: DUF4468 domain-containing protein [Halomonas sp.]|uniref:DUF4468 domain-containing protein n=1 Tax=Halomonas sp. TaxID=1486246 RepID=UPI002ACE9910|nr:DUF4468 domain-containing protein [Halomonas sp.]MDZ7852370.1 DUF4468 domain-containing protein [Halomonas sp.]
MIKLLTSLFLTSLLAGCAATAPPPQNFDREVSKVYETPGVSAEEIFNESRIWIAENFISAKAVIEYEDKENGILIGNGSVDYLCSGIECLATENWKYQFTMRLDIKEDRFKTEFMNIRILPASGSSVDITTSGRMDRARATLLTLSDLLYQHITSDNRSSDW